MKASCSHWTPGELRLLKRLGTPAAVQDYLDALPYRCEDGHLSARAALRDGRAHCFDGSLVAAAALRRAGLTPFLVDLCAVRDDDHMICAYQYRGRWGAVAKSNFPGLRLREPIFRTVRELVLSYFEFYFNMRGEKSLRSYSRPLRLPDPRACDWECDDAIGDHLVERLTALTHYQIVEERHERRLRRVDKRLFESQLVGVNLKGVRR
jgi:hypothetical protein